MGLFDYAQEMEQETRRRLRDNYGVELFGGFEFNAPESAEEDEDEFEEDEE
jgi:hypothetical protein